MADQPNDTPNDTGAPSPSPHSPPSRRAQRASGDGRRDGDVLAGPADSTRPSNPWPRLIAFGLSVVTVVFLAGLCLASFASAPDREIRVRDTEYQVALPKFLAVTSFGADEDGRTFGAFLVVPGDLPAGGRAFFSRAPGTGCNLRWDGGAREAAQEDVVGLFLDPCSDARYGQDGRVVAGTPPSALHEFETRREANSYVVSFDELTLGACHADTAAGCSPRGEPRTRTVPAGALPDDFGRR
ncbi:MAG: hypothetical protein M0R73_04090 [Dehalococcoidia bacterium]|nr:hypothetical protein [Dehalococcoidia bacterium]